MSEGPDLTPKEDLMLEALLARHRLGEHLWTFESRHRSTAESLAQKGLAGWKSGIVEKTIMVWMTDEARELYLSVSYVPPILRGRA